VRGSVCWAKMVHFWKPWKHAFWPPPECQEPFSMLLRHALSSIMVKNAGFGLWWAVTARFQKNISLWSYCSDQPLRAQTGYLLNGRTILLWLDKVKSFYSSAKQTQPQTDYYKLSNTFQKTRPDLSNVVKAFALRRFPAKRGAKLSVQGCLDVSN
jgi:hypothetical protein